MALLSTPVICPRCHANDKVQKVSAIVTPPDSLRNSNFTVPETGADQAKLARKLLPPKQPALDIAVTLVLSEAVVGIFFEVLALATAFWGNLVLTTILAGIGIVLLVIGKFLGTWILKEDSTRVAINNVIGEKWGQLYYCYRDDIVFNVKGQYVPSADIAKLVRNPADSSHKATSLY